MVRSVLPIVALLGGAAMSTVTLWAIGDEHGCTAQLDKGYAQLVCGGAPLSKNLWCEVVWWPLSVGVPPYGYCDVLP